MVSKSYFCGPASASAGLALLLLLALAGCEEGVDSSPQTPVVTVAPAADSGDAGSAPRFVVRAAPAPRADLAVGVKFTPSGCELVNAPASVTIAAGKTEAPLAVSTSGAGMGEAGCEVTAEIVAGTGYTVGAPASATLTLNEQAPVPQEPALPVVTIAADAPSVTEGDELSFTLTATPAPPADLTVTVHWSQEGSFLPANPRDTVSIPTTGTAELKVSVPDDDRDEQAGSVTATVAAGSGYTVGTQGAATVKVTDNDPAAGGGPISTPPPRSEPPAPQQPEVSISTAATSVAEGGTVSFTLTAEPAPLSDLSVKLSWTWQRYSSHTKIVQQEYQGPSPVTISASSSTATHTVTAPDDSVKQIGPAYPSYLIGRVEPGNGYVPALRPKDHKTIRLTDND